mgnify:CR=1 FL=1
MHGIDAHFIPGSGGVGKITVDDLAGHPVKICAVTSNLVGIQVVIQQASESAVLVAIQPVRDLQITRDRGAKGFGILGDAGGFCVTNNDDISGVVMHNRAAMGMDVVGISQRITPGRVGSANV